MNKNRTQASILRLYFGGLALLTAAAFTITLAVPEPLATEAAHWSQTFFTLFSYTLPFLIFGSLAAGLIDHFLSAQTITRYTPSQLRSGLLTAALLGLALPFGQVGIIPVAWVLYKKGFPSHLAITLILTAPIINLVAILATITSLGIGWTILRTVVVLLIALTAGVVFYRFPQPHWRPPVDNSAANSTTNNFWEAVVSGGDLLLFFLPYFVAGCLIAAVWETANIVPMLIRGVQTELASVLIGLLFALMQGQSSLTSGSLAAELLPITTTGAITIYLTLGTMFGVTTITTLTAVLKLRTLAFLLGFVTLLTLGLGLLINMFT